LTTDNLIKNHEAEEEKVGKEGKDVEEDVDGILMSMHPFHNHQHSRCAGTSWHIKDNWQYTAHNLSPTGHSAASSPLVMHLQHEHQQEPHHQLSLHHVQRCMKLFQH